MNESLANGNNVRDSQWTRSIAVGGEQFVERIKAGLGTKALGRQVREATGGYELRERMISYIADYDPKKSDIGIVNSNNKCNGTLVVDIF